HRRAKAVDKADAIVKRCEAAQRNMTPAEQTEFAGYMTEVKTLTPHIKQVEQFNKMRTVDTPGAPTKPGHFSLREALRNATPQELEQVTALASYMQRGP